MLERLEDLLFNVDDLQLGIFRELTKGITTRIFSGDEAMVSIVRVEPYAEGTIHSHTEEQWGFLIRGSVTRLQDEGSFEAHEGDFWRTPGGVMHGVIGGASGAVILDIFAPPRRDYLKSGIGFGKEQ